MIAKTLASLEQTGAADALVGLNSNGDRIWRCSGDELLQQAAAWQAWLSHEGMQVGDRVSVDLARGPQLVAAHLAILATGGCVVPINSSLTDIERARVLDRADLHTQINDAVVPGQASTLRLAERKADSPALLIFTSGTTGEPKGVPLSETNLEANLDGLARAWRLSSEDRLLHALPLHHLHGLVLALYGSLRLGLSVAVMERFDASLVLRTIERERITVFMGVPTMYHRMADAAVETSVDSMRVFISGSAPLATRDFERFHARFGFEPVERYGLSETMIVASNPIDAERRPGSVGRALPETEIRFANDGEIEVRGPAVMQGYWRAEDISAESFHDGFFKTGDLGRLDEAGYLVINGRKKELIIVGGSNVLPGEVEAALISVEGVAELAAAGITDPDRGEVVGIFVVPRKESDPQALETALRRQAESSLAAYKRPRVYRFLAELPRNAMGKVDRRALSTS